MPPPSPEPLDLLCQWCKGVIGVAGADGELIMVTDVKVYQEKFYHGPCYETLEAMAKYVKRAL